MNKTNITYETQVLAAFYVLKVEEGVKAPIITTTEIDSYRERLARELKVLRIKAKLESDPKLLDKLLKYYPDLIEVTEMQNGLEFALNPETHIGDLAVLAHREQTSDIMEVLTSKKLIDECFTKTYHR